MSSYQRPILARAIDCSQVADWSREIGWDVDYQQLGRGTFNGRFSTAICGQLRVTSEFCNRELAMRGAPPRGTISVALPIGTGHRGVFQGAELGENEAIFLCPGSGGFLKSPRDLRMFTLSVPCDDLALALWRRGRNELSAVLPTSGAVAFPRKVIQGLTVMLSAVTSTDREPVLLELEDQILQAIAEGLCRRERRIIGRDRVKHVRRARDYIDAHLGDTLCLSLVAANAGASVRTLELAFREVLGVTPVEYIRTRRLNRARQILLKSRHNGQPVTDAAVECGLFHFGYFSRDYQKLFGELPSQTLKTRQAQRH